LFHPLPEKYVTGAYIKIGFFESDSELIFQDEIHGNLFEQVEKTIDILFTKYIKAIISYEGISRVETFEYPKEALREALLNAVAHKDYASGIPIQISVYKDKIMFWNDGQLPENWTIENLLGKHSSKPYNPEIANAFFRVGYVESWGRGITKMRIECEKADLPPPTYKYKASDFWIEFRKDIYSEEYLKTLDINVRQKKAILYLKLNKKITNSIYQEINHTSNRTATRDLTLLVKMGILENSGSKGAGAFYIFK